MCLGCCCLGKRGSQLSDSGSCMRTQLWVGTVCLRVAVTCHQLTDHVSELDHVSLCSVCVSMYTCVCQVCVRGVRDCVCWPLSCVCASLSLGHVHVCCGMFPIGVSLCLLVCVSCVCVCARTAVCVGSSRCTTSVGGPVCVACVWFHMHVFVWVHFRAEIRSPV